jgi:hypothetical protein
MKFIIFFLDNHNLYLSYLARRKLEWFKFSRLNNEFRDDFPEESEAVMPWKTNESGHIEMKEGNPVFVHPDGREEPFNGDSVLIRIGELKEEAKGYRQKHSELKKRVQPILDNSEIQDVGEFLTKAKEAMELVKSYKEKGNPSAEEIEKVKEGVAELFEGRLKGKDKAHQAEVDKFKQDAAKNKETLHRMLVKGEFIRSEFLRDRTNVIPDMAYNTFGQNFVVEERENGKYPVIYAIDDKGEKIFSLQGSRYADPQEAIEMIVRSHPEKDRMLKPNSGGSSAKGGAGEKPFTGKTIPGSDKRAVSSNIERIAKGEIVVTK